MAKKTLKDRDIELAEKLNHAFVRLKKEIGKVIIGQEDVIEQIFIALLCGGHCLIIGVPGLAKTLMVKTVAKAIDLKFSRIQFTPDLMPADITGTDILEEDPETGKRHFRFVKGPIFANIILADEINRTPPKTQSALLEAMQEHQVSASGRTYTLDLPFLVLATQNPIEQEGTYPLPEAQLDRFLLNILIDYPSKAEEEEMVERTTSLEEEEPEAVLKAKDILQFQEIVRKVPLPESIVSYATDLVRLTRPNESNLRYIKEWVRWGASPRGTQHLLLSAKARALLYGRYIPDREDIRELAKPVLRHRIITSFAAEAEGIKPDTVIEKVVGDVK